MSHPPGFRGGSTDADGISPDSVSASPPAMGRRVAKGASWTIAANAARIGSAILILPVLTRILSPEDFGLMQIAAPFLFFLMLFNDLGMQPALVYAREPSERLWSSAFWTGIAAAIAMALILFLAAPFIAAFYSEPRATPILQVLALCMVMSGLMIVPGSWMLRRMQFRTLALVEVSTVSAGIFAALAAALAGWGVWALVVQQLVMFGLKSVILFSLSTAPVGLRFAFSDVRSIMGFSWGVTNIRVVWFLGRNVDILIIGRFLGTTILGFYSIAWRIMMMPIEIFSKGIVQVLMTTVSQMRDDTPRLRAAVLRTYRVIAIFTMPAMAGIAALSVPLTIVIFGETFAPAAFPIAALAIHGAVQSLLNSQNPVFMALGRLDVMMRWAIISVGVLAGFMLVGVQWGLEGASLAYLAAGLVCAPFNFRALMRLIGGRLSDVLRAAGRPALVALIMGLVVYAVSVSLPAGWSHLQVLAVCIPLGVALYGAGLLLVDRAAITEVYGIVRNVLSKSV